MTAYRGKALAPTIDIAVAAIELGADLGPRQPIAQQQNQACMPSPIRTPVPRTRLSLKFHALAWGQFHHALHRHDDTTYLNVTVH